MLAGIGRALLQLLLTVAPSVAQGALAVMGVPSIDADAGVLAQAVHRQPWESQWRKEHHRGAYDTSGSHQLMSKVISASRHIKFYSHLVHNPQHHIDIEKKQALKYEYAFVSFKIHFFYFFN